MSNKVPDVPNVFTQLEAALCLLARAKGEQPARQYFYESTANVRHLLLDGGKYQIVLTKADEEGDEKQAG